MVINTDIYGVPEVWGTSTLTGAGFKWVNFNNTTGAKPRLMDGAELEKTPHGALIENSVCTQALGTESIYSHIIVENAGTLYHCDYDYIPWFLSESDDTERNSQNSVSTINLDVNFNSWLPYQASGYYWNYSDYCRPFAMWYHKKLLFVLRVQLATSVDVTATKHTYNIYDITPEILEEYPYITFAFLESYVDNSNTDTPNRSTINQYAQLGVSPNVQYSVPNVADFQINYAMYKSMVVNNIPLWGANVISFNEGSRIINICMCDEEDINVYSNGVTVAREYNDDMAAYLIQQAACFGLFVRIANDSNIDTSIIPLDNDDIICGVLDDYEVGHGQFTRGAENRTNKIWNWQSNQDSNFDPYSPPLPYDDTTVFGYNSLYNTFIQYYALSAPALKTLCNSIYAYINGVDTDTEDINKAITKTFYTNNPLDVIISLKRFPFDITQYSVITAQPQPVQLGNLSIFSVTGYKVDGHYTAVDFGSYFCEPAFNNSFLDYAPYSYYDLIVPFCGTVRLDPALFIGKTLNLKMVVDLYTGACTCYILANSLCIDSVSGNCAIDIPITGIQSADFQNSVQNAITNVKNARINTAAYNMRGNLAMSPVWTGQIGSNALFKGGAAARIGNALSGISGSLSSALHFGGNVASAQKEEAENYIANQKAEYDLQHVQTPFASVGSQSAANNYVEEMYARLIIYRPKFAADYNESVYAATEAHACLINGKVGDFAGKGLTIGNVKTNNIVNNAGISPTAAEQAMLKNAFSTGVIL